ncbi:hypothetical protein HPB52_002000 [Rhipicephalus sanguineus]|uniref:Tetraspanin-15 n=1 Tax=Rhipicephalus sanguineus TaxID=34632 RepID=A0A9D4PB08_RHISA|nr:hypothetical protein HPB52_002000 [Rhipicephalus sanguineus]
MNHQSQLTKSKSKKRRASKSSRTEISAASSNADEPIRSTPEKTAVNAGRPSDSEASTAAAKKTEEKRQSPKRTAPTTNKAQHRHSKSHSLQTNPARQSGAKPETAAGQVAGANTSALGKAALSSLSMSTSTDGGTISTETSPKSGDPDEAAIARRGSQPAPLNAVQSMQVVEQGALQLQGQAAVDVPQGKQDSAPKTEEAKQMVKSAQTQPQDLLGAQAEAESPKAAKPSTHAETQTTTKAGTPPATGPAAKPVSETKAYAKTETQQPKQVEQQTAGNSAREQTSGTPPLTPLQGEPAPVMVDTATQYCLPTGVPPARRNAAVDTGTDAPDDFCAEPELPFASAEYTSPRAAGAKVAPASGQRKADLKRFESTTTAGGGRKSAAVTSEAGVAATTEATVMLDVNPYVRYPLLTMNLLIWLMGLTLLLVGAYAYVDTWTQTDIPSHSTTYNIYSMFVIKMEITVMLFGVVTMSLSFCGCVGALRENTCLLNVYSSFITALLLINLVVGLIVFFLPSQIKKLLSETFSMELIVHYRDSPDFQRLMDSIQERMQCCGISKRNFRDWNANMYFNCSRANPSSERCSVPYSCCKRNSTEQVVSLSCGRNVLNMTDYDAWFQVYTGNCLDSAHRYVRENVTIITGLCLVFVIVLAFVQMVTQALIDEILIIRRIYEKFYERAYDMRAAEQTEPSAN